MSKPLTIFWVSAADNLAALTETQSELLAHGHDVQGRALHARKMQARRDSASILLGEDGQLFDQLAMQVAMADLFVLVAPDDHDAACLAGMAYISGIPVAVIAEGAPTKCCFMVSGCVNFWCDSVGALLDTIAIWPNLHENEEE